MSETATQPTVTLTRFGVLFGLGSLGIVALLLTIIFLDPMYAEQADQLGVDLVLLAVGTGVQSMVMLAVSVLVGLYLAPRLDFRSHVLERVSDGSAILPDLRTELAPAFGGGAGVGGVLVLGQWIPPLSSTNPRR